MTTTLRNLLESQGFHRIPLQKLKSGHYKFSLKINGVKGTFILDTGASTSCIDTSIANRFQLKTETSDVKAAGAGATGMDTLASHYNNLTIGSKQIHNISVVLFDLSHVNLALTQVNEAPIDGILGADLLKKLRAVIDYGRNVFYLK